MLTWLWFGDLTFNCIFSVNIGHVLVIYIGNIVNSLHSFCQWMKL